MKWNPFYAADPKLNKVRPEPGTSVLVTCLDKRGARKVVQAHCSDDAEALYAAVEYLQRSHQHLKDQIYTSTPAGSPESTLPQNDPKGVLV